MERFSKTREEICKNTGFTQAVKDAGEFIVSLRIKNVKKNNIPILYQ